MDGASRVEREVGRLRPHRSPPSITHTNPYYKAMKRNNLSPVTLPLCEFIRRVAELLARRGITARSTVVAVLRGLKERGIWPVKSQEKNTENSHFKMVAL